MSRRRRGILGKLAGVQPACYAGPIIGGCHGKLSEEHPLSEALRRGRRIQVGVSLPDGRGGRRVVFSSPPIDMAHASAKILCEGHNGELNPADQEAVRLQLALQQIARRDESPVVIPSERVIINGRRFAQFLCKRVVGQFVIHDPSTPPSADLVRYAFSRPAIAVPRLLNRTGASLSVRGGLTVDIAATVGGDRSELAGGARLRF